ncbi:MAG: VCBS repeat-containing protein, partial [Myxococcaceae bacterium]|nr:VCBS repeat-containing protein [Myxococcaceae bacterium]
AGASSLEPLADALAAQVVAAHPEPPVALAVSADAAEQARTVAALLAARLAAAHLGPVVLDGTAEQAEAAARQRDLRTLVRLRLGPQGGRVHARGDLVGTWVNFWSGRTPSRPPLAAALAASVPLESAPVALEPAGKDAGALELEVRVLAPLPAWPAAVGLGDTDGDGTLEPLVLLEESALVLSADGGLRVAVALPGGPAEQPTREPFGAIAASRGQLAFVSGRRAPGAELPLDGGAGRPLAELSGQGLTLRPLGSLAAFAPVEFQEPVVTASPRNGLVAAVGLDTTLLLRRPPGALVRLPGAGSAARLADLDGDRRLELVTTSERVAPPTDELRVFDAEALERASGPLAAQPVRWKGALPAGRAVVVACGDLDGDGQDEVLLGLGLADGTGRLALARRAR